MNYDFIVYGMQALTQANTGNSTGGNFWGDMIGQIMRGETRDDNEPAPVTGTGPGVTEPRWPQSPDGSPTGERGEAWPNEQGGRTLQDNPLVRGVTEFAQGAVEGVSGAAAWFNIQRVAFLVLGMALLVIAAVILSLPVATRVASVAAKVKGL